MCMKMAFIEMVNIYKRVGIFNYTFECLLNGNDAEKTYAINKLKTLNNEDDVLLFIANI